MTLFAYGAVVSVEAGGRKQMQTVGAKVGYLSAGPAVLHFGLGDASSVEAHRQLGGAFFVALRLQLDANGNFVTGEGDVLHDDVADRDIIGIGDANRDGVNRNATGAKITDHRLGATRRGVESIRNQHHAGEGRTAFGLRQRFESPSDGSFRAVGP